MVEEAKKTNELRGDQFRETYFSGKVIDVGCARDLVVPHAEPFDWDQGDAQNILQYRSAGTYDCVHSSHCLEHMKDVPDALRQWWELIKPGGHLVLVVPEEDLYEQGFFPSKFNADHKATFRFRKTETWSPRSYEIESLVRSLPGAEIISAEIQDHHYDHSLKRLGGSGLYKLFPNAELYKLKFLLKFRIKNRRFISLINHLFVWAGIPVDQTHGDALAQIQVVARKRKAGQ